MAQVIQRNFSKRICFIHAGEHIQPHLSWAVESGLSNFIILTPTVLVHPKVSADQRLHWIDVWMKKVRGTEGEEFAFFQRKECVKLSYYFI